MASSAAATSEDTYTPLVSLKEVDVSSGEEDEVCLYKHRAKLYRFDSEAKQWKERGTGNVKLLQHKENKIVRFLLRQEKTLKVVANHVVDPIVEIKASMGSDTTWVWAAQDFADNEVSTETFALRFKEVETAEAYKKVYEKAQATNKSVLAGKEVELGEAIVEEAAEDNVEDKTTEEGKLSETAEAESDK